MTISERTNLRNSIPMDPGKIRRVRYCPYCDNKLKPLFVRPKSDQCWSMIDYSCPNKECLVQRVTIEELNGRF